MTENGTTMCAVECAHIFKIDGNYLSEEKNSFAFALNLERGRISLLKISYFGEKILRSQFFKTFRESKRCFTNL